MDNLDRTIRRPCDTHMAELYNRDVSNKRATHSDFASTTRTQYCSTSRETGKEYTTCTHGMHTSLIR